MLDFSSDNGRKQRLLKKENGDRRSRLNVLVWGDDHFSPNPPFWEQTVTNLKRLLSPYYVVAIIDTKTIKEEPWMETTAMLVLVGDHDSIHGKTALTIADKIQLYVTRGGKFLGIGAGSYFGSELIRGANYEHGCSDYKLKFPLGQSSIFKENDYRKLGEGEIVLSNFHPEFTPNSQSLNQTTNQQSSNKPGNEDDKLLQLIFKQMLETLHLEVNNTDDSKIPKLTHLQMSSNNANILKKLINKLEGSVGFTGTNNDILVGTTNKFKLYNVDINEGASEIYEGQEKDGSDTTLGLEIYSSGIPSQTRTPYFNHGEYFENLKKYRERFQFNGSWGDILIYGEVISSTSTILEKNTNVLSNLPDGVVCSATIQCGGRGRGGNVWVSPQGLLPNTGVIRMKPSEIKTAPLVFIQYLGSLAMVEAIRNYGEGYEDIPIRLKWPNDIYALNPDFIKSNNLDETNAAKYLKIGGYLVGANYLDNEYIITHGMGINVDNEAPTTSLNQILTALNKIRSRNGKQILERFTLEGLLSAYLTMAEKIMSKFRVEGFKPFESLYYSRWLHSGQIVHLEDFEHTRAKVLGITSNGMLLVEELEEFNDNGRAIVYELQPDGNSFDMFKGLIKKKIT